MVPDRPAGRRSGQGGGAAGRRIARDVEGHGAVRDPGACPEKAAEPGRAAVGRRGARAIREQFWAQRDRIRLFTIASDMDTVPWELLYPVDLDNDDGFLVEQFPVVRRVYGQGRARVLRLDRGAGFIVPPRSPANALDEVAAVRGIFPVTAHRGMEAGLAEVLELLDAVPSVLHFAGHNTFTDETGSLISLDGGPLRPNDSLRQAAAGLRGRQPAGVLQRVPDGGGDPRVHPDDRLGQGVHGRGRGRFHRLAVGGPVELGQDVRRGVLSRAGPRPANPWASRRCGPGRRSRQTRATRHGWPTPSTGTRRRRSSDPPRSARNSQ